VGTGTAGGETVKAASSCNTATTATCNLQLAADASSLEPMERCPFLENGFMAP